MNKDEALKMAIEALEHANERSILFDAYDEAIQACKKALAQPQPKLFLDLSNSNGNHPVQPAQEPVALERDYNFMRDLAIGCEDALNELHNKEPVGYIDKEQLNRWEKLRGTPYEAPERAYVCFSKIPFKSDLTDCSLAVYTHPAPSWQGFSNDEVGRLSVFDGLHHVEIPLLAKFIRAIEQALKEKNHV